MPELPEVETVVRRLREPIVGRTIVGVSLDWNRMVGRPTPAEFRRRLPGRTVLSIDRRAKYLVFALSERPEQSATKATPGGPGHVPCDARVARQAARAATPTHFLLIHLKMSGRLNVVAGEEPPNKHDHVIFDLDDGRQLRFNDIRKFGRVYLLNDPEEVTGKHGPEPLDPAFTLPNFRKLVKSRSGAIKPLLLNQTFLAGVGNIYADESLWRAKIHPLRTAASLKAAEIAALYRSIRQTLRQAIRDQGTDAGDGVIAGGDYRPRVYGREGRPCQRCHQPIRKITVGQRGTHYCARCQPKRGQ